MTLMKLAPFALSAFWTLRHEVGRVGRRGLGDVRRVMRDDDRRQVLAVLLLARIDLAGRRGRGVGALRRGAGTLDAGVHVRFVVVADVEHLVPALEGAGERLQANVVGAAVAAERDEADLAVRDLAALAERTVRGLDAAHRGGRTSLWGKASPPPAAENAWPGLSVTWPRVTTLRWPERRITCGPWGRNLRPQSQPMSVSCHSPDSTPRRKVSWPASGGTVNGIKSRSPPSPLQAVGGGLLCWRRQVEAEGLRRLAHAQGQNRVGAAEDGLGRSALELESAEELAEDEEDADFLDDEDEEEAEDEDWK